MKNYLFAPFKDDDDKIEEFNAVVNALNYVVDAEETYHHESALHGLRVFVGRLESYYDVTISKLSNECAVAVADERIIKGLEDKVRELKADNKRLYQEHKECRDALEEQVSDLMIDKDRLVEQVGSNSSNSSSTHTHTIKKEIAEYMSHNEGCGGARLFLIPRDEFKNDEYNNTIYWDDGVE